VWWALRPQQVLCLPLPLEHGLCAHMSASARRVRQPPIGNRQPPHQVGLTNMNVKALSSIVDAGVPVANNQVRVVRPSGVPRACACACVRVCCHPWSSRGLLDCCTCCFTRARRCSSACWTGAR
jgi:hypothetical protein